MKVLVVKRNGDVSIENMEDENVKSGRIIYDNPEIVCIADYDKVLFAMEQDHRDERIKENKWSMEKMKEDLKKDSKK